LVLNPRLDPLELLETICEELRLRPGAAAAAQAHNVANASEDAAAAAAEVRANDDSESRRESSLEDSREQNRDDARRGPHRKNAAKPASAAKLVSKPASKHAPRNGSKAASKTAAKAAAKAVPKSASAIAAGPASRPSAKALYDMLSAYLLQAYARGERVVLIIDEAQNLSTEALEQVRLLTNLETETQKLLQIILIGQPELRDMLMRPELRQLAQRITARYHLRPLDEAGTAAYLRHRLTIAGASRFPFSADAVRRLHRRSGGVPRLINVVAERALLGGYAHDLLTIDANTVERAADEALAPSAASLPMRRGLWWQAAGLAAVVVGFAALLIYWPGREAQAVGEDTVATAAPPTPTASAASAASKKLATGSASAPVLTNDMPGIDALLRRLREAPVGTSASANAAAAATTETDGAWSALIARWNAPAALRKASADACPAVPAKGWRCLRSRASLDQLLRLDRPVLLRLRSEPHAAWAHLQGVRGDHVRLALDADDARATAASAEPTQRFEIDRVALAGVWNGEFLAIWPAPDTLETRYAAGDTQALAWVRARLDEAAVEAHADTAPAQAAGAMNDARALDAALRVFQQHYGLPGDGRVRADTEFALATRTTGPSLARARDVAAKE
jgi:general secretion pathway protein A